MSRPLNCLAITSSTGVISAAIGRLPSDGTEAEDGSVLTLAATTIETDRRHAEEISPLISELLSEAGLALDDLDLLAVDRGPGRFTGLRVGLATVKSLAFALEIGVVGVSSLEILGASPAGLVEGHDTVTAVIDARRNEVFQQRFRRGKAIEDPQVGPAESLAQAASGVVLGDGLDRYIDSYQAVDPSGVVLVENVAVDAVTMLALAVGGERMTGDKVEPLYLREPDVNPNVKTRPR